MKTIDEFDDLIYHKTKFNFLKTIDDCGGYFSVSKKEIAISSEFDWEDDEEVYYSNLPVLFHEIGHYYQYELGNIPRYDLYGKLDFFNNLEREQEAVAFSQFCLNEFFKKKLDKLYDEKTDEYFTLGDIMFLRDWHEVSKDDENFIRIKKFFGG